MKIKWSSKGASTRLSKAVAQDKDVILVLEGRQAAAMRKLVGIASPRTKAIGVAVSLALIAAGLAVVTIAAVCAICMVAMHKGYKLDITNKPDGSLDVHLDPPKSG